MAKIRAIDMLCRLTWAITEPALRQMVLIATRSNDIEAWKAVREQKLAPLDNTFASDIKNGVGVLPIEGPIFRHANLFTEFSGATSLDMLARDFNSLVNNDAVESILLEIDSPGGEAAGVSEFADMIYNARGKKPIYAYADDLCASAAYWIASAADKIIAADTAALGSIGVIAAMSKPPGEGENYIEFISSQSPYKRPLYQEDGSGRVQQMVDSMCEVFIEKVARNRGVDISNVMENFGNGWVKIGRNAVESGLADEVGSFTATLNSMRELRGLESSTKRESDAKVEVKPATVHINHNGGALNAEAVGNFVAERIGKLVGVPNSATTSTNPVTITANNIPAVTTNPSGGDPMSMEATVAEEEAVRTSSDVPPTGADNHSNDAQRVRALEQQLEALHMERHSAEARGFADVQIAERRAFPAEREAMISALTQAAQDDLRIGGSVCRVDLIKKMFAARPQHQLTMEQLAPALADVLNRGDRATGTQHDDRPLDSEQLEALIGKTSTGKSVLKAIKTGQPLNTR
jgi:ClpP class serine protease